MQGGAPLDWIRPLTPQGTREHGMLGCYRGGFSHWNLKNLKPGFTARYVKKKERVRRQYEGWKVAKHGDVELAGEIPMAGPTGISDAVLETENLILMVIPTEKLVAKEKARQELTRQLSEGVAADYQARSRQSEAPYSSGRKPLRFDDGTRNWWSEVGDTQE